MTTREDVERCALEHLGVPFVLGKRVYGQAVDCVGLILAVSERLDLGCLPIQYNIRDLLKVDAHALAIQHGLVEKEGSYESSDIVRLEVRRGRPIHFGIVVGSRIIHACDKRRKVVSDPFFQCLDTYIRSTYSWPRQFSETQL